MNRKKLGLALLIAGMALMSFKLGKPKAKSEAKPAPAPGRGRGAETIRGAQRPDLQAGH